MIIRNYELQIEAEGRHDESSGRARSARGDTMGQANGSAPGRPGAGR